MSNERGTALILAVMGVFLTAALSASLAILSGTEVRIVANIARAKEARYAAEAGLELVILEVMDHPDWNDLCGGTAVSAFADGPPGGTRRLGDGSTLDLDEQTAQVRIDNPTLRLFGFGPFSNAYVAVWIGADAAAAASGGVVIRATSFGPGPGRKAVEATLSRTDVEGTRMLSWREIR